jgi:hypothetical protein
LIGDDDMNSLVLLDDRVIFGIWYASNQLVKAPPSRQVPKMLAT